MILYIDKSKESDRRNKNGNKQRRKNNKRNERKM